MLSFVLPVLSLLSLSAALPAPQEETTFSAASQESTTAGTLPIVNLGYARHQAISNAVRTRSIICTLSSLLTNDTQNGFYNFSNIRYGAAPVGDLRFSWP